MKASPSPQGRNECGLVVPTHWPTKELNTGTKKLFLERTLSIELPSQCRNLHGKFDELLIIIDFL